MPYFWSDAQHILYTLELIHTPKKIVSFTYFCAEFNCHHALRSLSLLCISTFFFSFVYKKNAENVYVCVCVCICENLNSEFMKMSHCFASLYSHSALSTCDCFPAGFNLPV